MHLPSLLARPLVRLRRRRMVRALQKNLDALPAWRELLINLHCDAVYDKRRITRYPLPGGGVLSVNVSSLRPANSCFVLNIKTAKHDHLAGLSCGRHGQKLTLTHLEDNQTPWRAQVADILFFLQFAAREDHRQRNAPYQSQPDLPVVGGRDVPA